MTNLKDLLKQNNEKLFSVLHINFTPGNLKDIELKEFPSDYDYLMKSMQMPKAYVDTPSFLRDPYTEVSKITDSAHKYFANTNIFIGENGTDVYSQTPIGALTAYLNDFVSNYKTLLYLTIGKTPGINETYGYGENNNNLFIKLDEKISALDKYLGDAVQTFVNTNEESIHTTQENIRKSAPQVSDLSSKYFLLTIMLMQKKFNTQFEVKEYCQHNNIPITNKELYFLTDVLNKNNKNNESVKYNYFEKLNEEAPIDLSANLRKATGEDSSVEDSSTQNLPNDVIKKDGEEDKNIPPVNDDYFQKLLGYFDFIQYTLNDILANINKFNLSKDEITEIIKNDIDKKFDEEKIKKDEFKPNPEPTPEPTPEPEFDNTLVFDADKFYRRCQKELIDVVNTLVPDDFQNWRIIAQFKNMCNNMKNAATDEIGKRIEIICNTKISNIGNSEYSNNKQHEINVEGGNADYGTGFKSKGGNTDIRLRNRVPLQATGLVALWKRYAAELSRRINDRVSDLKTSDGMLWFNSFIKNTGPSIIALILTFKHIAWLCREVNVSSKEIYDPNQMDNVINEIGKLLDSINSSTNDENKKANEGYKLPKHLRALLEDDDKEDTSDNTIDNSTIDSSNETIDTSTNPFTGFNIIDDTPIIYDDLINDIILSNNITDKDQISNINKLFAEGKFSELRDIFKVIHLKQLNEKNNKDNISLETKNLIKECYNNIKNIFYTLTKDQLINLYVKYSSNNNFNKLEKFITEQNILANNDNNDYTLNIIDFYYILYLNNINIIPENKNAVAFNKDHTWVINDIINLVNIFNNDFFNKLKEICEPASDPIDFKPCILNIQSLYKFYNTADDDIKEEYNNAFNKIFQNQNISFDMIVKLCYATNDGTYNDLLQTFFMGDNIKPEDANNIATLKATIISNKDFFTNLNNIIINNDYTKFIFSLANIKINKIENVN